MAVTAGMTLFWIQIALRLDPARPLVRSRAMARTAPDAATFGVAIAEAYATKGGAVELGTGMLEGSLVPEAAVRLPLATMNRHGLIAGATARERRGRFN